METIACTVDTPMGKMLLTAQGDTLMGAWFEGQRYFPGNPWRRGSAPVLERGREWLESFFAGENPCLDILLAPDGTEFQRTVWELLRQIPYGQTVTYGELARRYAQGAGIPAMSPRGIGAAVGKNPLSLFIPCHRVVGAGGALTGYAGGLARKRALLLLEGVRLTPDGRVSYTRI